MSENHELIIPRAAFPAHRDEMQAGHRARAFRRLGLDAAETPSAASLRCMIPSAVAAAFLLISSAMSDGGAAHAVFGMFNKKNSPGKTQPKAEIHSQLPGKAQSDDDLLPPPTEPQVEPHSAVGESSLPELSRDEVNTSPDVDTSPEIDSEPAILQPRVLPHAALDALFDSKTDPEPKIDAPQVLPHAELDTVPQALEPKIIPHVEIDSESAPAPILQPKTVLHKELDVSGTFDESKRDFRLEGEPLSAAQLVKLGGAATPPALSARLWKWLSDIELRPASRSAATKKIRAGIIARAKKHKLISLDEMIDFYNSARMDGDPRLAGVCLEIILQLQDPNTVVNLPNFGLPRPSLVEEQFYQFDRHFAKDEFKEAIDAFIRACDAAYGNPLVMPIMGKLTWKERLDKINDNVEPELAAPASAAYAKLTARMSDLSKLAEFRPRYSFDIEDDFAKPMAKNRWEF